MAKPEENLGLMYLREFMKDGEVFIYNTKRTRSDRGETYSAPTFGITEDDVPTLEKEVQMHMRSGKYESVRVIDVAFAKDGTRLTTYVALVGVLKSLTE